MEMDEFFRQYTKMAELYQQYMETVYVHQKNMEVFGLRQIIGTGVVYLHVEMEEQWLMANMSITTGDHGTWGAVLIYTTAQPFLMMIWEEMPLLISRGHMAVVVITVVVSFCVKLENTRVWSHAYVSLRFGDAMVIQTVRGRKMKKSAVMIRRWTLMIATLIMETCDVLEPAGVSDRIGFVMGRMTAGTSQMKPDVVSGW
jgi:hypothetical protein